MENSPHDPYAPLRLSGFRRFLFGHFIVVVGQQMQKVAVGWEIYERTGSALHLGYVGLVQFIPLVAFAIWVGHVTDTYNRKRVLMGSLALMAIANIGLSWNSAQRGSISALYALLFLTGTARAFQNPARAALLPGIVPREIFSNAASWSSSGIELASMIGPAIGGLLIGFFRSAVLVYLLNAMTAITFAIALAGIRYQPQRLEKNPITLRTLSAGMMYVWQTKVVLAAIMLDLFAVLLGGAVTLMPIYAKDILHVGPRGLGWLMAAPAIGAFTMALVQAHRRPYRNAGMTLLIGVFGFGASTILFGISKSFWFSLAVLFMIGVCDNISVVIRNTLVQLETPDEMRGRVSALNHLFIGTSNELGGFESGLVAGFFGPVVSVVSGGMGTILVVLAVARLWPELRRYGSLVEPSIRGA